jgi:hypothetical protein
MIAVPFKALAGQCRKSDHQCIRDQMLASPVHKMDFFKNFKAKPLQKRIFPAPSEMVEFISLDNQIQGFDVKTHSSAGNKSFIDDLNKALAELPPSVVKKIETKFLGVFLAQGTGGTAYSDLVNDRKGLPTAGFIVLDTESLSRTANEWASWKENTVFSNKNGFTLEVQIAEQPENNRERAISFILLHELGHIASIGTRIHPDWRLDISNLNNLDKYSFAKISWKIQSNWFSPNRLVSNSEQDFPLRNQVVFYKRKQLNAGQMQDTFKQLASTDFPSLYAATSVYDDWAESFATYVHSRILKRPYEVRIFHSGKTVTRLGPCWGTPRCSKKEKFLQNYFSE